ncbi:MAG: carbamate kinase [Lachnospiraceae bacterium]|nr:carbamate kinase [Lachnospiraceae bacterium]
MGRKIVIALGGNALGDTAEEQLKLVEETAKSIVDLVAEGNDVVIAHGNGPQVGMINLGLNYAYENGVIKGSVPFPECGAMSEGYIGYHLQNAVGNELRNRNIKKEVATIITQVIVNEEDSAFKNPTKPIGAFYDKETALKLTNEKNWTFVEDAGRGFRRVVASPKPIGIEEIDVINNLVDNGFIVITVGGGGIPVINKNGRLIGVPAVIDKDFASAKLAELINADKLFILTAVDRVAINFGKPNEKKLEKMTLDECEKYIAMNEFAKGSMLPKVEAAMSFVKSGGEAIIADLKNAKLALIGESGTKITK